MKNSKNILLTIICVLSCISFTQAQDIQSSTQGISVNLNASFGSWSSDSFFFGEIAEIEPRATGFNIRVGYGLNQNLEAFASFTSLSFNQEFEWNKYNQIGVLVGAKYNFGATLRKFRPFVEAGLSFNKISVDPITFDGYNFYELKSSGLGGSFGGGIQYFITEYLSVSASGTINLGAYNSTALSGVELNNIEENLDFTITTIHIGLSYYFD